MAAAVRRASPHTPTRTRRHRGGGAAAETPLTWPAAELDAGWPQVDPGLAAWRYHRLLDAIEERAAQYQPTCQRRCCSDTGLISGRERDILIAVPVADSWRRAPGQTTIAAYECTGQLLGGEPLDGTVLASFPLVALRQAIRRRLRVLRALREVNPLRRPLPGQQRALAAARPQRAA